MPFRINGARALFTLTEMALVLGSRFVIISRYNKE